MVSVCMFYKYLCAMKIDNAMQKLPACPFANLQHDVNQATLIYFSSSVYFDE